VRAVREGGAEAVRREVAELGAALR
jgi:hypothetical protein